ncbi:MAG: transporter substrate-binding domain-containing protein, partial [Rhodospirillales bacterium]|nr:transporter substrate-binding domain-containing protein [Rhodospirillales bacterium]
FVLVGNFLSYDPYALMLRRDDSAFRLMVDRTLADLFYTQELERIFNKWFSPLGIPLSGILRSTMTAQMHVN